MLTSEALTCNGLAESRPTKEKRDASSEAPRFEKLATAKRPLLLVAQALLQIRLGAIGPIVRLVLKFGFRSHGLITPSWLWFTVPARCTAR